MCKTWSVDEVALLRKHYPFCRAVDMEQMLNKPSSAIFHKASRLQISKDADAIFKIRSVAHSGKNSGNFKGYRRNTPKGYVVLYMPEHPNATKHGVIMEHRYVMSLHLCRPLENDERVHHINGDRKDNKIENLKLMSHGEHTAFHHKGTKQSAETKNKISQKAIERLKDKRNHPSYREIDIKALVDRVVLGEKVTDVCNEYGICRYTYYKKKKESGQY